MKLRLEAGTVHTARGDSRAGIISPEEHVRSGEVRPLHHREGSAFDREEQASPCPPPV